MTAGRHDIFGSEIDIELGNITIRGILSIPEEAKGIVIFAHGAGSSRLSPRNQYVAKFLQDAGLATLLMDLFSSEEEQVDDITGELRFNIPFLAERVNAVTDWVMGNNQTSNLAIGYFGASTGAAAALVASVKRQKEVRAVVSRGGRPDLAASALTDVQAPTLLIVGGEDRQVLRMNEDALEKLNESSNLVVIPGATHLFEEPGKLDEVAEHAKSWFLKHLDRDN